MAIKKTREERTSSIFDKARENVDNNSTTSIHSWRDEEDERKKVQYNAIEDTDARHINFDKARQKLDNDMQNESDGGSIFDRARMNVNEDMYNRQIAKDNVKEAKKVLDSDETKEKVGGIIKEVAHNTSLSGILENGSKLVGRWSAKKNAENTIEDITNGLYDYDNRSYAMKESGDTTNYIGSGKKEEYLDSIAKARESIDIYGKYGGNDNYSNAYNEALDKLEEYTNKATEVDTIPELAKKREISDKYKTYEDTVANISDFLNIKYNDPTWNALSDEQKANYLKQAAELRYTTDADVQGKYYDAFLNDYNFKYATDILSGNASMSNYTDMVQGMAYSGLSDDLMKYIDLSSQKKVNNAGAERKRKLYLEELYNSLSDSDKAKYDSMSADERKMYVNYKQKLEDAEKAQNGYSTFFGLVDTAGNELAREYMDDYGIIGKTFGTFASVGQDMLGGVLGAGESAYYKLFKDGDDGYSVSNAYYGYGNKLASQGSAMQEGVMNDMSDLGKFIYQTLAVSGTESILAGGIGNGIRGLSLIKNSAKLGKVGEYAAGAILGLGAMQKQTQDMILKGADTDTAIVSGIASGIFEGLFESVSIGEMSIFNDVEISGGKDLFKQILKESVVNFSEEANTEIANILFDTLVNGEYSDYSEAIKEYMAKGYTYADAKDKFLSDAGWQIIEAGIGGALMGGVMGAGGGGLALYDYKKTERLGRSVNSDIVPAIQSALLNSNITPSSINASGENFNYELGKDVNTYLSMFNEKVNSASNNVELLSALNSASGTFTNETLASGGLEKALDKKINRVSTSAEERAELITAKNNLMFGTYDENANVTESAPSTNESVASSPLENAIASNDTSNKTINALIENNIDELREAITDFPSSKAEQRNKIREYIAEKNAEGVVAENTTTESVPTIEEPRNNAQIQTETALPSEAREVNTSEVKTANTNESVSGTKLNTSIDYSGMSYNERMAAASAYNIGKSGNTLRSAIETVGNALPIETVTKLWQNGKNELSKTMSSNSNLYNKKGIAQYVSKEDVDHYSVVTKKLGGHAITWNASESLHRATVISQAIAKATGLNVYLYRSDSRTSGSDGFFSYQDGAIYLDVDAGFVGEKSATIRVAAHELTHFISANAKEEYKNLEMNILGMLQTSDKYDSMLKTEAIKQMVNHLGVDRNTATELYDSGEWKEKKTRSGESIEDIVNEELVAEGCEMMLKDNDILVEMCSQSDGAKNFVKKAIKYVKELRNAIRDAWKGLNAHHESTKIVERTDELINSWNEGLKKASEIQKARNEKMLENYSGLDIDEENGRVTDMNSVRYVITDESERQSVIESIMEKTGATREEATKYFDDAESTANLVLKANNFGMVLDDFYDNSYDPIKNNSDYPQGTVDFTNLCRKRAIYTDLFDRLQKEFPNRVFNAKDLADIRNILIDEGQEVACGLCFVEDRRQKTGEIADAFIKAYSDALKTKGKEIKYFNSKNEEKMLNYTKASEEKYKKTSSNVGQKGEKFIQGKRVKAVDDYIPTQYDLVTYPGSRKLLQEHPYVYYAWERFNSARGQQSARLTEGRAEYHREILKYSDKQVKSINANGGLRIFSFSDFETTHIVDLIQVITDASAKGLKIQAYTKVPQFAKLIENTGIKLNRSLIAGCFNSTDRNYTITKDKNGNFKPIKVTNGVTKDGIYYDKNGNGHLVYDIKEGINITDKDFLSIGKENRNIGNILVGMSDDQIKLAMKDDFVDYIIPFHTGQAKDILKRKNIGQWTNYKNVQTDKNAPGGKNKAVNIYKDILDGGRFTINNKEDFVNAFLEVCKERELTPRFSKFLDKDTNGNFIYTEGYEKFLIDFKLFDENGNILPQQIVRPNFSTDYIKKLINDEIKNRKSIERASEKSYELLKERYYEDGMHSSRGKGYIGHSMSVNARDSYDEGNKPISKWSKTDLIDAINDYAYTNDIDIDESALSKLTLNELRDNFLKYDSWHHTGSFYNRTYFYSFDGSNLSNDLVSSIISSRKKSVVTEEQKELKRREAEAIETTKDIYNKMNIIMSSGVTNLKTIKGLFNRIKSDEAYLEAEYEKAIEKLKDVVSLKVKSWEKLEEGHERKRDVASFKEDAEKYIYNVYKYDGGWNSIMKDIKKSIMSSYDSSIRYSSRDSEGKKLSEQQIEYFSESKIRDDNGSLKVMYHGTESPGFTVFDPLKSDDKKSFFFTDSISVAGSYSGTNDKFDPKWVKTVKSINDYLAYREGELEKNNYIRVVENNGLYTIEETDLIGDWYIDEFYNEYSKEEANEFFYHNPLYTSDNLKDIVSNLPKYADYISSNYPVYLNVNNPLVVECNGCDWDGIKGSYVSNDLSNDYVTTREISEYALDNGYDGVVFKDIVDQGYFGTSRPTSNVVVCFDSNQIKLTKNKKPTSNEDIRYSTRDESVTDTELIAAAVESNYDGQFDKSTNQALNLYAKTLDEIESLREQRNELEKSISTMTDADEIKKVIAKELSPMSIRIDRLTEELTENRENQVIKNATRTLRALYNANGNNAIKSAVKSYKSKRDEKDGKSVYKAKVIRRVKNLKKMIDNPTDKKHIPTVLITPIKNILNAIDFETPDIDANGVRKKQTKSNIALGQAIFDMERILTRAENAQIENYEDVMEFLFDPYILANLTEIATDLESFDSVDRLSANKLKMLNNMLASVEKSITSYGKNFASKRAEKLDDYLEPFNERASKLKARRGSTFTVLGKEFESIQSGWDAIKKTAEAIDYAMVDAFSLADKLGMQKLFASLNDGFIEKIHKVRISSEYMKNQLDVLGESVSDLEEQNIEVNFRVNNSYENTKTEKFYLSKANIMELYGLWQRKTDDNEQGKSHILGEGFNVEGKKNSESFAKVNEEEMEALFTKLTDKEKRFVDNIVKYFSVVSEWGNETSNLLYGYSKFMEDVYYPIHVSKNVLKENPQNQASDNSQMYRLRNLGVTKSVKQNAKNQLKIGSIFDTFNQHIDDMSSYSGLLPALEDANRFINKRYTDELGNTTTVKETILKKYGTEAWNTYKAFIETLNKAGTSADALEGIANKVVSFSKGASVGANLRVVVQQPTSIVRAGIVINPKYLIKAMANVNFIKAKQMAEEAQTHSDLAWYKAQGFYGTDSAPTMKNITVGNVTAMDKIRDYSGKLAGLADDLTWGWMYKACEYKVEEEQGLTKSNGQTYYDAVNELFEEVINRTQVVDTPLGKSKSLNSKNFLMRSMTNFFAEPTKTYNMVMNEWKNMWREKSKESVLKFVYAGLTFMNAQFVNAVVVSFIDALRDDDYDKTYWEKYYTKLFGDSNDPKEDGNFFDNLNPMGYVILLRDIKSIMDGYDVTRLDATVYENVISSLNNINKYFSGDTKLTTWGTIVETAKGISQLTGIPINNMMRVVTDLGNTLGISEIKIKKPTTKEVGYRIAQAYMSGNTDSAERWLKVANENKLNLDYVDRYTKEFLAETDAFQEYAELYKTDPEKALEQANDDYDYIDSKTIKDIIEKAYKEAENIIGDFIGNTQYTSSMLINAIDEGDGYEDIVDALYIGYGEETGDIKRIVTTHYKPLYIEASNSERLEIQRKLLKLSADGKQIYSADDFAKWLK